MSKPRLYMVSGRAKLIRDAGVESCKPYDAYFSATERDRLILLESRFDESIDRIAVVVAEQLKLDPTDPRVDEETRDAVDRWDDARMEGTLPSPKGRLQELLSAHIAILDKIRRIRNTVIKRWLDDGDE